MAIVKPVAVYNAENNIEAQMICEYLCDKGVEAHPTFDESLVGFWSFGVLPGIHKPQVWVEKSNVETAKLLLTEYEQERSRRRAPDTAAALEGGTVTAVCEDCGGTSTFAASKRGTVQDCSHCGSFVDVGDSDTDSEYWNVDGDS